MTAQRRPGDVWAIPRMDWTDILKQGEGVWSEAEIELLKSGYPGKCLQAYEMENPGVVRPKQGWLTPQVARSAAELGAPVQQVFTMVALRIRARKTA